MTSETSILDDLKGDAMEQARVYAKLAGTVEQLPADINEDALALLFAEKHVRQLRYCHTRGKWYLWDGARWKLEQTQRAFQWARTLCREYNRRAASDKERKTLQSVRMSGAVERFAMGDERLAVTAEYWDADPWLLATPEGTVELQTGDLRYPNPADHITMCTRVMPQRMPTPIWDRFLKETTAGDQDLVRFLKQMAGYCLTGNTSEHSLFFLYGPGGNGKSVFVNTIAAVLGEYATTAPMSTFTAARYDSHPTDLASLAGARMVTASETEEGRAWAESRIKALTGGDPVTARFMRQDFFTYQPAFKLVFLGNHKPVLRNVDDAARRRFNIVPFTHKPKVPDPQLSDRLEEEHPGILQWMIEGCLDWQRSRLQRPAIVDSATAEYFSDSDLFGQWLDECTDKCSPGTGTRTTVLYRAWKTYAENAGEFAGSQRSFRENMQRHGYEYRDHLPKDNSGRGYLGIQLPAPEETWKPYSD